MTMKPLQQPTQAETARTGRRNFLKLAGLGAVAGSAAAVAGEAPAAADEPAAPAKRGYRETPHVRKFYELARF